VLSGALVEAYKPSPAVYELAITSLGLDPSRTLMVAAHAWDLRAAASHGLKTAFVARPGADPPRADDRFDLHVEDLGALRDALTR
jgi:2-haloacid dehalogenase